MASAPNAPYAGVICQIHGRVDIDKDDYLRQMARPDSYWTCPKCGNAPTRNWYDVVFDDDRYEELNPPPEGSECIE